MNRALADEAEEAGASAGAMDEATTARVVLRIEPSVGGAKYGSMVL